MEFSSVDHTLEILNTAGRGNGFLNDDKGYMISGSNVNFNVLIRKNTLSPVITGMSDILYKQLFDNDQDFKSLFSTVIVKKKDSLCYASLKANDKHRLEHSGFALSTTHLISQYVMGNLLMKNEHGKVELDSLIELWRTELSGYREGEVINMNNHRENLINHNLTIFPKLREDLLEQKRNTARKNIFS